MANPEFLTHGDWAIFFVEKTRKMAAVLIVVALLSTRLPAARRAAGVDPALALRDGT